MHIILPLTSQIDCYSPDEDKPKFRNHGWVNSFGVKYTTAKSQVLSYCEGEEINVHEGKDTPADLPSVI